jgi:hypothetical protein
MHSYFSLLENIRLALKSRFKTLGLIQASVNIDDPKTKQREIKALLRASEELQCNNLI